MRISKKIIVPLFFAAASLGPGVSAQSKPVVVEEIIARVNSDIVSRDDLNHAGANLENEVREECQNCSADQLRTALETKQKNLLRDLIDQALLVQRATDSGINVDTDVIKRLDQIRIQYKLPDMESLEREVTKSGQNYEDFKKQIKDQLLTQQVIQKEAGEHIVLSHQEIEKYYEDHKSEFVRPETVVLREIFVSTDGKPEADIPALRKKAESFKERVLKNGDDFGELAKHFSDSTTAAQDGNLGTFERGQLDPKIAEKVFALKAGEVTDVLETKTGFEVLQVVEHYQAGEQPLDKVEGEISNRLYDQKMEPALREYLKTLREDSYIQIKPGYVDTAAVDSQDIEEVSANADKEKSSDDAKKKAAKRFGIFPKKDPGA
jgi:peptidyl-prolyl cis-trans isomerase SurA